MYLFLRFIKEEAEVRNNCAKSEFLPYIRSNLRFTMEVNFQLSVYC